MTNSRELVPADEERLAHFMATARMIPPHLQKSPADCLLVIRQAIRWRMDPFAVAQECSSIQGKVMYHGKLVAAVINTHANLKEHLSYRYHSKGDARAVTVSGHIEGEEKPRTIRVALKDARTTNKVWQTQPDQQLAYHGVRVWARRHVPELMLGVYSPEEFPQPTLKTEAIESPPLTGSGSKPKPEYDDAIPDFDAESRPHSGVDRNMDAYAMHDISRDAEDSAPDPQLSPEAGSPAPPDKVVSAPPGQGGAGASSRKGGDWAVEELKVFWDAATAEARKGRDALAAFTLDRTDKEKKKIRDNIEQLKALYPDATAAPHDAEWVGPADADDQTKTREAYEAGQQAKAAGARRQALPGEYRGISKLEAAWVAGFNGESPPMV